jgi:hypothetical protein
MLSLKYSSRVAETCIEIATDITKALELSQDCSFSRRPGKYTVALHLVGALLPIISVIVRPGNSEDLIRRAINLFDRALIIMAAVSPGSLFARYALKQLSRPIRTAREIINSRWLQYAQHGGSTSDHTPDGASELSESPSSPTQHDGLDLNKRSGVAASPEQMVDQSGQTWDERLFNWDDSELWGDMTGLYDTSSFVSG